VSRSCRTTRAGTSPCTNRYSARPSPENRNHLLAARVAGHRSRLTAIDRVQRQAVLGVGGGDPLAVGRDRVAAEIGARPDRGDGARFARRGAVGHVEHVDAEAGVALAAGEHDALAVGQPARAVRHQHAAVGEDARLPGPYRQGHQPRRRRLGLHRQHPLPVGAERAAGSRAQPHRVAAVGATQEHRIAGATALDHLGGDQRLAVGREVPGHRAVEPREIASRDRSRRPSSPRSGALRCP
jgi:hypothetical protein